MAYCPKCGAELPSSSTYCTQCGNFTFDETPTPVPTGGMMAWSIITLLLCTIPGIVAIVQTSGINKCATRAEQDKKISSARTWNIVGTVLGLLYLVGTLAAM